MTNAEFLLLTNELLEIQFDNSEYAKRRRLELEYKINKERYNENNIKYCSYCRTKILNNKDIKCPSCGANLL